MKEFFVIFRDPKLLPAYGIILINMFLVSILFGFLPVYLHSIGYNALQSGTMVSVGTLSYLGIQPFAGHFADKVEIRLTVIAGLLLGSVAICALTFTQGPLLTALVVLGGVGVGTVWTNTDTLVSKLSEGRKLGASIGAAQSFKELGDMTGPLLIGVVTQYYGVRVAFVSCGVVALLFLLALIRAARFKAGKQGREA